MKISKRFLILIAILTGMVIGGFAFLSIFRFIGGMIVGGMATITVIALLFPNLVNEINPSLSDLRKERLAKTQFRGFRRTILHPTRLPAFLGGLWGGLALLVMGSYKNSGPETINVLFLPCLFLIGLSGYQMVKLNEYINRYGDIIHGFPAKLYGYVSVLLLWGGGILIILSLVFNWK